MSDPRMNPGLELFNSGGMMMAGAINTYETHDAENQDANVIDNARSLTGMYRPLALGGVVDGFRLLDEAMLAEASGVAAATSCDAVLGVPTRFALGFMKSTDNRVNGGIESSVLLSEDAFGHAGAGGSLGIADPGARMSFGYAMNKQGGGLGMNVRGQALADAAYRALGYRRPDGGGLWF